MAKLSCVYLDCTWFLDVVVRRIHVLTVAGTPISGGAVSTLLCASLPTVWRESNSNVYIHLFHKQ